VPKTPEPTAEIKSQIISTLEEIGLFETLINAGLGAQQVAQVEQQIAASRARLLALSRQLRDAQGSQSQTPSAGVSTIPPSRQDRDGHRGFDRAADVPAATSRTERTPTDNPRPREYRLAASGGNLSVEKASLESLRFLDVTPSDEVFAYSSYATVTSYRFSSDRQALRRTAQSKYKLPSGDLVVDGACVDSDTLVMVVEARDVTAGRQILAHRFTDRTSSRNTWALESTVHHIGSVNAVTGCDRGHDGPSSFRFFTGGSDHTVRLWSVREKSDRSSPYHVDDTHVLHQSHKAAVMTMTYNDNIVWSGGNLHIYAYDCSAQRVLPARHIKLDKVLCHLHSEGNYLGAECRHDNDQYRLFDLRSLRNSLPTITFGFDRRQVDLPRGETVKAASKYSRGSFNFQDMMFAAGDQSGSVRIWDLRMATEPAQVVHKVLPNVEVRHVVLQRDGMLVSGRSILAWQRFNGMAQD
jgi:WD40 repeat protein